MTASWRQVTQHMRRLWRLPQLTDLMGQIERRLATLDHRLDAVETAQRQLLERVAEVNTRFNGVEHADSAISDMTQTVLREGRRSIIQTEDSLRDLLDLVLDRASIPRLDLELRADRPVAADSPDHYAPRGTANDNTRHPRFVRRCEQLYREIRHLDIGCAGGGLVWDFAIRGHFSVGIEGSDFSLLNRRAEWRTIPDRLFTADITRPFNLHDSDGKRISFNIITAWELFEHIPTDLVSATIGNIASNLAEDGMLVCSIATFVDRDETTGVVYHQTVKPREWWVDQFAQFGLRPKDGLFEVADFVRGSGNPRAADWDVRTHPDLGFHMVLQRENCVSGEVGRPSDTHRGEARRGPAAGHPGIGASQNHGFS